MQSHDVIILGAGVSGLWLANKLSNLGYNFIIFDNSAIGGAQTLASQGMIHGGQKYALTGSLSEHSYRSLNMAKRWQSALNGTGEIDLKQTKLLSEKQYMWSAGGLADYAAVFAAAKIVNSETKKLKYSDYPSALEGLSGLVYELPEQVLEVSSLLKNLVDPIASKIFKGNVNAINEEGFITIDNKLFQAKAIVSTAGLGNENIIKMLSYEKVYTQRRPLKQIVVKSLQYPLFGHGITTNPKPRVTITSHPCDDGGFIWYLGGNIAETCTNLSDIEAMKYAEKEMQTIFPKIAWGEKEWAVIKVDRAEPFVASGQLPPGAHVQEFGNVLVGWPTKLTFAPDLADKVCAILERENISASDSGFVDNSLPNLEFGDYPWQKISWFKSKDFGGL